MGSKPDLSKDRIEIKVIWKQLMSWRFGLKTDELKWGLKAVTHSNLSESWEGWYRNGFTDILITDTWLHHIRKE